jgi:hypothetical protein
MAKSAVPGRGLITSELCPVVEASLQSCSWTETFVVFVFIRATRRRFRVFGAEISSFYAEDGDS